MIENYPQQDDLSLVNFFLTLPIVKNMKIHFTITLIFSFLVFASSCSRPNLKKNNIIFSFPKNYINLNHSKLFSTLDSSISYDLLCFGVNIKSSTINNLPAQSCQPEQGIIIGAVEPGKNIQATVPNNSTLINIEVYGFLRNSISEPCPTLQPGIWNWAISKTYLLYSQDNITITHPETNVLVKINLPDSKQNISVSNNWPPTCLNFENPNSNNKNRIFPLSPGGIVSSGNKYKINSKLSFKSEMTTLKGSKYEIKFLQK